NLTRRVGRHVCWALVHLVLAVLVHWPVDARQEGNGGKNTMSVQRQNNGSNREMVRAEKIVKRFGDLTVLNGVDLSVKRGEVVVVIGPSGSGKTTLLRCINHLEKIDDGRIDIEVELMGYMEKNVRLVDDNDANITTIIST